MDLVDRVVNIFLFAVEISVGFLIITWGLITNWK